MLKFYFCYRLSQWIRGHALISTQDYVNAVMTFRLDNKDNLKDNVYMITSIARALFLDGHYKQAFMAFQKVRFRNSIIFHQFVRIPFGLHIYF